MLGRSLLAQIATLVTPDTILRWHRRLIAAKWTHRGERTVRSGLMRAIRELILGMADTNPSWGYCRIQGEPKKPGRLVDDCDDTGGSWRASQAAERAGPRPALRGRERNLTGFPSPIRVLRESDRDRHVL